MAQQHFDEENHISYPTFLFVILLSFVLGAQLGAWHVHKHCTCKIPVNTTHHEGVWYGRT